MHPGPSLGRHAAGNDQNIGNSDCSRGSARLMTCDEDLVLGRLLNVFVDICLLRAGPQDLPGSVFLVVLTALLSLLTGTLVIVGTFGSLDTALAAQLLDILLLLGLLRLVLQLTGKSARFLQTAAALFGSGALINLVTMPLQLLGSGVTSQGDAGELSGLFYLFLIIWALVIVAHIVRQALEVRMASGILISLAYFLIVNYVVQSLFTVV